MSILEQYGRVRAAGTGLNPQSTDSYIKKANARDLADPTDLMAAASRGDRTATMMLRRQSKLTPLTSDLQPGSTFTPYSLSAANNLATRNDSLSTRTSQLNSGGFQSDIANYTDRTFLQQAIGVTRLTTSAAANLISSATRTVPVYTTGLGTTGGAPTPDGRYDITIGYGFVLYGTLTNGGYA